MKKIAHKLKKPLLFALAMAPIGAVAGYFTILYQLDFLSADMIQDAVAQLGSIETLKAVYLVQTVGYALFCGFTGYLLAEKLGLMRPLRLEKRALLITLGLSLAGGILFSLDYWTFGAWIPGVREATDLTLSVHVVLASVLYGGVIEELMLRLFMMSLLAFLLWKLFFRKRETVPTGVIVAANLAAAILFAAGHLPATVMNFGTLTPLLLFRCFLLNGGFGLLLGWIYRKFGIQYAMLSHATLHMVSKLIWFFFV